jgi:hypothetical protein
MKVEVMKMKRVKNYMEAYKSYAKSEKEKLEAMKKDPMYSQEYIADQEKKMNKALEAKRQEYLKEMNNVMDDKIAVIKKPDTANTEYQTAVSNIFSKVQLIGKGLTPKLLKEILEPAIEKQDTSTIEAVRSFITGIQEFPGGEPRKRELLEAAPRFIDQAEVLSNAKAEIGRVFSNSNFGTTNMNSGVSIHYLEQSGVFEL